MKEWEIKPLKSVGNIKFGMTREEVRKTLDLECLEFKKNQFSRNTTDNFGICQVFYSPDDRCEAVEVSANNDVSVKLNGHEVFLETIDALRNVIKGLKEEDGYEPGEGNYVSSEQSVGICVTSWKVISILAGRKDYYD